MTAFFERIEACPLVYDGARAADVLENLGKALSQDRKLAAAAALIARDERVRNLLAGAFSASPYLAALALREPSLLAECLSRDPDAHLEEACAELAAAMAAASTLKDAMALLRRFKRRVALLVGLADLGQVWSTDATLAAMSTGADAVVAEAVRFLFRQAREAGHLLAATDASATDGYFVIAMGKLGAFELNYSSDIDIIVFYDAARAGLAAGVEAQTFFVRLTRDLVRLLQEHTADGYAFRTDLRLRPDPGATQIALSKDSGLIYYESFGQNWERAALIKARVVAGDIEAGEAFLPQLAPFIWRKYLDYAAIADIHAMKRRVHAFKGHGAIAVAGHDIKLGRGGIRDIEFFAQTQQLIAGGRHPELRTKGTLETLQRLAEGGWIGGQAAQDLSGAYRFLRRVENRLQMIADQQTHTLPSDPEELRRVAILSGFTDTDAFADTMVKELARVETHYGALFERLPEAPAPAPAIVFQGDEADPNALAVLQRFGFHNPAEAMAAIRAWQSGRYPATRSARARERLTEFLPFLLDAFGRTAEPDLALATFDKVIAEMPAGVQLFSLLAANPSLLRLIADIMGTAPRLAQIIGRRPRLLDAVLDPGFFGVVPTPAKLKELVRGRARSGKRLSGCARPGAHRRPRAGLPHRGSRAFGHDLGRAGRRRLCSACRDADRGARRHRRGRARAPAWARAGRAGGRGGHGQARWAGDDRSLGPRPDRGLRLCRRRAIGRAEEPVRQPVLRPLHATADQRALRAHGRGLTLPSRHAPQAVRQQGPVATKLSSFIEYQRESAWTWEQLALTRARVISGPAGLRRAIGDTIREALARPRDRAAVAAEVRTMRTKIEAEKGTQDIWDLKHVPGGLIDAEFLTQFLEVVSAAANPAVLDQSTAGALSKLVQAGVVPLGEAERLVPAVEAYSRASTQCLRLCLDKPFVPDEASRALKDLLARAADMPDFATLEVTLKESRSRP